MFRFTETPTTIVAFFTVTEIRDESQIMEAMAEIFNLLTLTTSTRNRLILDFHGVQYMSSAMIGSFSLVNKKAKVMGIDLRLANVEPSVMKVFAATKLNRVLRFEHRDDTLELFNASVPLLVTSATIPCPECGQPLRTKLAKQCLHCGADWH